MRLKMAKALELLRQTVKRAIFTICFMNSLLCHQNHIVICRFQVTVTVEAGFYKDEEAKAAAISKKQKKIGKVLQKSTFAKGHLKHRNMYVKKQPEEAEVTA